MLGEDVVAGAFLGLALQILREAVKSAKDRSYATKHTLERLESTIQEITPLIDQIDLWSTEADDFPKNVVEKLKLQLQNATQFVNSYSELKRRNLFKRHRYKRRITEVEVSLRWMANVDVQVNQWRDIKKILSKIDDMNAKLDQITRRPDDNSCFWGNHNVSETDNNDLNKPETEGQSSHDGPKLKANMHLQWNSKDKTKKHEFGFFWKKIWQGISPDWAGIPLPSPVSGLSTGPVELQFIKP